MTLNHSGLVAPVVLMQKILLQVLFRVSVMRVTQASSVLAAVDVHFCD